MTTEDNWLLSTRLRELAARLEGPVEPAEAERLWREALASAEAAGAGQDADVVLPLLERSLPELRSLLSAWDARKVGLPAWDQAVLNRAMNAFRRRLKLTRADEESSSGRNPLSKGATSSITGVRPPDAYAKDVWDVLVAQGRLRDAGDGILESTAG